MTASVITSLRLTGRAMPNLLAMALPWLIAAMIAGLAGSMLDRSELGWQINRFILSMGACAMLLVCARTLFSQTPLPYQAFPWRELPVYLMWWIPVAALLYLSGYGGPWISGLVVLCLLGRLTLLPLFRAFALPGFGLWQIRPVLRASLGTLTAFLLLPAIILLLFIPIIGGIATSGADLSFMEAELPSKGGPLSPMGLASELLACLLPLLAAATVGFYQGALLREWQSQPKSA